MTWSKLDDGLHGHPKALDAGLEALGLWTLCLSYCGAYRTDGHIKRAAAVRLASGADVLDRLSAVLVRVGLWEPHPSGDGWQFHDYLAFNPSRAELESQRSELSTKRAEAGRKGAASRWQRDGKSDGCHDGKAEGERDSRNDSADSGNGNLPSGLPSRLPSTRNGPVPSRPDPDPVPSPDQIPIMPERAPAAPRAGVEVQEPKHGKRAKGTRIPEGWKPAAKEVTWAAGLADGVDAMAVAEQFVDHFTAKAGPDALKVNWDAAFRTWVRRDVERGTYPRLPEQPPPPPPKGDANQAVQVRDIFDGKCLPPILAGKSAPPAGELP